MSKDRTALGDAYRTTESDIRAIDDLLSQDGSDGGDAQENSHFHPGARIATGGLASAIWCRGPQVGVPGMGALATQTTPARRSRACKRAGDDSRPKTFEFRTGGANSVLKRANGVGASSLGGATVAPDYAYELEKALVGFSNVCGVWPLTTETGADLPYPTEGGTNNTGTQLNENEETPFEDDNFGSVTFRGSSSPR